MRHIGFRLIFSIFFKNFICLVGALQHIVVQKERTIPEPQSNIPNKRNFDISGVNIYRVHV